MTRVLGAAAEPRAWGWPQIPRVSHSSARGWPRREREGAWDGAGVLPAPIWPGTVVLSSAPPLYLSLLAVVFPQDLLEKGLEADNFAMLGLGDIVIPGEDTRGRTSPGLGEAATGHQAGGSFLLLCFFCSVRAPPASHRGWELRGWVPEPPGSPLGVGAVPVLSRCHERAL